MIFFPVNGTYGKVYKNFSPGRERERKRERESRYACGRETRKKLDQM